MGEKCALLFIDSKVNVNDGECWR